MNAEKRHQIQAWMIRLADGDRDAFEPLFRTLGPILTSFVARFFLNSSEAQDVAQEVLVSVFRRAYEFDPKRDALSWVYGIAAYEAKTLQKRRLRRQEVSWDGVDLENHLFSSANPEDGLIHRERALALGEALKDLRPIDQEAILASWGEGPRPKIPAATLRKRLERAMRRLRTAGRLRYGSK